MRATPCSRVSSGNSPTCDCVRCSPVGATDGSGMLKVSIQPELSRSETAKGSTLRLVIATSSNAVRVPVDLSDRSPVS